MIPQPIQVMLVEDNPDDATLVRELLIAAEPNLFRVEWVRDLGACLERLAREPIDVILSDLNLPDSQGLNTFMKMYTKAPTVPIVVLTGSYEEADLALKAVRQGAQDYLVKGHVDGKLLSRVLQYAIERKQAEAALHAANRELQVKLDQVAWLNHIMMDREQRIIELRQQNQALQDQVNALQQALEQRASPTHA